MTILTNILSGPPFVASIFLKKSFYFPSQFWPTSTLRWYLKNTLSKEVSQETLLTSSLSSLKSALLVSRVEVLVAVLLLPPRILNLIMVIMAKTVTNCHVNHETFSVQKQQT